MSGAAGRLEEALERAVRLLQSAGLAGEVYGEDARRLRVAVSDGRVESLEDRRDLGVGVRVFRDRGVGFAYTSDLSDASLKRTVDEASAQAPHTGPDDAWRLPAPEPAPPLEFENEDPAVDRTDVAHRVDIARRMEKAALEFDPRVERTRRAVYQDVRARIALAGTGGFRGSYAYTRALAYLDATASESGRSQVGYHVEYALGPGGIDPEGIGREAARRAVEKLGARPAETGKVAVVLDREVVAGLLEALSPALSARRVLRGTSLLKDRVGTSVASPALSVYDDGRHPRAYGSVPFDGEGWPTRRTPLITAGVLEGYLFDTYTAVKLGGRPGNTGRAGYHALPAIGPSNLMVAPGEAPLEALVEQAGEGLYLREVMGLHTVNPVSGDFSLGGTGRWIRGGRVQEPVDRLAIAGNLLELLGSVSAVGSDLRLFPGGGAAPSLLVASFSIAGAD